MMGHGYGIGIAEKTLDGLANMTILHCAFSTFDHCETIEHSR